METRKNNNSEYLRKRKSKMVEPETHELVELDEDIDEIDRDTTPLISPQTNDNKSKKKKHIKNGRLSQQQSDGDGNKITSMEDENLSDAEVEIIDKSSETKPPDEGTLMIALQVFIPYIIAGFGTVGAGMVLDLVQHWPVFTEISEVFILVPSLLGLKGNLEMTLASRLSTQANLGKINCKKELWKMIFGNMALVQAQAIVVGFLASVAAMVMGWIPEGKFDIHHGLLLCASSIFTASIASLILGSIMVAVVILSKKCNVNPDNIATPIAASLGDLITLSLLSFVSRLLYDALGKDVWLAPLIISIFVLLTPLWIYISVKNKYVNHVIYSGWVPILSAMLISSAGGLILDFTVKTFDGIAVFQPVINGVGGNLVAVQASRISTYLHRNSVPGVLPDSEKTCANPFKVFCGKNSNSRAARALLSLVIPGQILFIYVISYMKAGHTSITLVFNVTYLTAAFLQVVILLFIADWMVHLIWVKGDDPDNVAIPYLTAIGDLLGTAFLALAFAFLYVIGDRDSDVGE